MTDRLRETYAGTVTFGGETHLDNHNGQTACGRDIPTSARYTSGVFDFMPYDRDRNPADYARNPVTCDFCAHGRSTSLAKKAQWYPQEADGLTFGYSQDQGEYQLEVEDMDGSWGWWIYSGDTQVAKGQEASAEMAQAAAENWVETGGAPTGPVISDEGFTDWIRGGSRMDKTAEQPRYVKELYTGPEGWDVWRIVDTTDSSVVADDIASDADAAWMLNVSNYGEDKADLIELGDQPDPVGGEDREYFRAETSLRPSLLNARQASYRARPQRHIGALPEVSTRSYVRSHSKEPRGVGTWAFQRSTSNVAFQDDLYGEVLFLNGSYAEVKRQAQEALSDANTIAVLGGRKIAQDNSITVQVAQLTEVNASTWVTEASDLGLAPGVWPDTIKVITSTAHDDYGGESTGFWLTVAEAIEGYEGELQGYNYRHPSGYQLTVFND